MVRDVTGPFCLIVSASIPFILLSIIRKKKIVPWFSHLTFSILVPAIPCAIVLVAIFSRVFFRHDAGAPIFLSFLLAPFFFFAGLVLSISAIEKSSVNSKLYAILSLIMNLAYCGSILLGFGRVFRM